MIGVVVTRLALWYVHKIISIMLFSHAYPLRTHNFMYYLIFKEVVLSINNAKHLSPSGFILILELSYFANHTIWRTLNRKQAILDNMEGFIKFEPIIK